jgi:hypothetical protein
MRGETLVRQGEFGRRSGILPFAVDPHSCACQPRSDLVVVIVLIPITSSVSELATIKATEVEF